LFFSAVHNLDVYKTSNVPKFLKNQSHHV